jgi:Uma2 family endonuclease
MNQQLRRPDLSMTTQAAEGQARRRWTVAEIEAMVRAGIIDEQERFELIGGEVVPMPPKGIRHELLKSALNLYWATRLPAAIRFTTETTFHLNEDSYVEPDFVFYRRQDGLAGLAPQTALLAVEVADSSLAHDLVWKSKIYAHFGIREVWVINAVKLVTRVHRSPTPDGYADTVETLPTQRLVPDFATELAVVLDDLELV